MLTLYRLSQRRIPALIALMAILMLFIAPEVSKTLEHQRMLSDSAVSSGASSDAMDGMDMAMMQMNHGMEHTMGASGHHDMSGHAGPNASDSPRHLMTGGMGMMDDFFCGYCQLLAHFPVLAWVIIPLISLLLMRSRVAPHPSCPVAPETFFPCIYQPRAPPAF